MALYFALVDTEGDCSTVQAGNYKWKNTNSMRHNLQIPKNGANITDLLSFFSLMAIKIEASLRLQSLWMHKGSSYKRFA